MMDCIPIAILNALRWLGYDVTLRGDYNCIYTACKCKVRGGTHHAAVRKLLRLSKVLKVTQPRGVTVSRLKSFLRGRQTAMLICFRFGLKGKGHCCLVIKRDGQLQGVNFMEGSLCLEIPDAMLERLLKHTGRGYPAIWFLEKLND